MTAQLEAVVLAARDGLGLRGVAELVAEYVPRLAGATAEAPAEELAEALLREAPEMPPPEDGAVARDGRPRIVATVSDTGSGVAAWSLHCGDRWLLSAYDADDGRVVWERDEDLPPGAQTLTLRVEDGAGNRAEFTRNLVVGGK